MAKVIDDPTKEAILSGLRVVVLAIIPVVIVLLEGGEENWKVIAVTIAVAGLKALDEYIHTLGKNRESETLIKGLTRF